MATDNNIHKLFKDSDDAGLGSIDTEAVIRRSRARRRPAQFAIGGALVLALGGFGVVGLQALGNNSPQATTVSQESAEDSDISTLGDGADTGYIERAPADKINLCKGTVAEIAPSETGLELTVDFHDATTGATSIEGTATLTNNGTEPVVGYTAAGPAITVAQNGIVLWHSNGAMIAMAVDVNLAPGESLEYATSFQPVICGVEDDMAESFGEKLPPLPSGTYEVSAAIDVIGESATELVTGPASTVTLK